MRKDKIIKGLEKYGYHLCDACNRRSRQAKENLKKLNGENWKKVHSTEKCKNAYRKNALSNLEKINSEEGIKRRYENDTFKRAHETRLKNGVYEKAGFKYKFCDLCKDITIHNGGVCTTCWEKEHGEKYFKGNPNCGDMFKKLWESEDYKEHMSKILSEQIAKNWNNPELAKIMIKNLVSSDSAYKRDENGNITHINDKNIDEVYSILPKCNILNNIEGFFVSTGRTQNSKTWQNKEAFDQYLINMNIGWFCYIKFYIDKDDNVKPLVVGKTGTKLVSNTINDICFSYWDTNKGPARQFLKDRNVDWDKTKVFIIPCNTEIEALEKEKELKEKFNLFYS